MLKFDGNQQQGVYFGERKGVFNAVLKLLGVDRSVIKSLHKEGHIAVFGGSGSGKSSAIVIPTLRCICNGHFFAIDIKGDLHREFIKANPGKNAKVFSLRGTPIFTYDPFEFLQQDGEENLVSDVRELVNSLLQKPHDAKDPVWIDSARELLTAGFLYFINLGLSFIDTIISVMTTPPSDLIKEIGDKGSPEAKVFVNNFLNAETIADSKFLVGVSQEITNRLSIIASDIRIRNALVPSENQIRWAGLEKESIFLSVPEDRLEQYSPVIAMMMTQMIRSLERRPEKYSREGANRNPILLMLDEFPRLGKLEVIPSAISTLRSKNVTICLVCQSLAQLDAIYGRETRRIILDNCSYKAVLNVNDFESQKYFSDLAGTKRVAQLNTNVTYDTSSKATGYSDCVSFSREPRIHPHEFATLTDVVLLTPNGYTRVKKTPHYKTGFVTKVRETVKKAFGRIKSLFSRR